MVSCSASCKQQQINSLVGKAHVMTIEREKRIGKVEWFDLTVNDASKIREFYERVVGWTCNSFNMGDYEDYCMIAKDQSTVAGICHARGSNADLPPQWMVYINVDDLTSSLSNCTALGGQQIGQVRAMPGHGRYCFIRDPAGAVCALFEPENKPLLTENSN